MPEFSPEILATWTEGRWTRLPAAPIARFTIDSRKARAGDCFVALRTAKRDGHAFIAAAAAQGAIAAIVEQPVADADLPQLVVGDSVAALQACAQAHRERFSGIVIGITGSAGKTSTKELIGRLLGAERTLLTEKNLNNYLGVPLTLLQLDERLHRFAVVEVGINRPGEMEILASLVRPNVGVVTNVGAAHLEGLGSLERVAAEKALLLRAMRGDGFVVYPEDCDRYGSFRELRGSKRVVGEHSRRSPGGGTANVTFQTKHKRAESENAAASENEAMAPDGPGEVETSLHLPGRPVFSFGLPPMTIGMRMNAILAATVALSLGIPESTVRSELGAWKAAEFRGEIRRCGDSVYYLDCYNANPLSMRDALSFFSERFVGGPRLFVIGSMRELGRASEAAHHSIGEILRLSKGDRAIFIGESAPLMQAGALASGNPPDRLAIYGSADDARSDVRAFRGSIFLKGSRAFKLETLIPEGESSSC